jgi:chemotaxis protein methyltransferase CheR
MKKFKEEDLGKVVAVIKDFMDFNPENYKVKPLVRRIRSRMRKIGIDDYGEYAEFLKKTRGEKENLKKALTINLTSFFRNKTVFDTLKKEILPHMKDPVIWSAGCSNGAEPYAIAILCKELDLKCIILGTDIDKESIKKAYEGIYDETALAELPAYYRLKYFEKVEDGYRVNHEIKNSVDFQNLDLKDINFENKFDLIFCRNVLIYLKKEFQESILISFSAALKENGFLVLGKVESISNKVRDLFYPVNIRDRIYANNKRNSG